jgi:CRISPR-associated protein Csm1
VQPDDAMPWIVQLADWLSSGEREEDEDDRVPYLRSIFSRLNGYDRLMYQPLKRLTLDDTTLFPRELPANEWKDSHESEYDELWTAFEAACREVGLKNMSVQGTAYLETLYSLLMEFTWCVPSTNHQNVPDVSLFDHLRTTAALAACLAADRRDAAWCKRVNSELEARGGGDQVCLLVGGDISGVQAFLYTLTSSGAAKSLRARSFYLQLLTEVVAQYMLDQLGLPITNLLYAGGGNFFILAGVTQDNTLKDIQRDVSQELLGAHDGALHLALAAVPVQAGEFARGRFHEVWDRLHLQLGINKRRPLANLDPAQLAQEIGAAMGEGGDTDKVCNVCGRESEHKIPPDDDGVRKCNFCASLERLGTELSHATHLIWLKSPPESFKGKEPAEWWRTMMAFGMNIYAADADNLPGKHGYVDYWPGQLELVRVNPLRGNARFKETLFKELERGVPVITANRLFAQLIPLAGRQVMTFDELAQVSRGVTRWGVLRMDVDNLGDVFRYGFKQGDENTLTLSRVASLSFALRLFFEGWLPNLGQVTWPHTGVNDPAGGHIRQNTLYVQYAGGDDVFVVGAWDVLPEYATRIRESFRLYTGHNPTITVSGGITLADERFPLYLAAEQAAEAEHAAKNYHRPDGSDKDALSLFGQTMGWEQYPEVSRRAHLMAGWCDGSGNGGEPLPKSIIQSFLAIDSDFQHGAAEEKRAPSKKKRHGTFYYGPWMWHAVYKLTRTIEALGKAPEVAKTLAQWEEELLSPDNNAITIIGLSARWAELLTRKESKE